MIAKFLIAVAVVYVGWLLWRGPKRPTGRPTAVAMPADDEATIEARSVLGVPRGASAADIRAAHRRLVAVAHPDRGGSADAARRINAARDLLLKRGAV